MPLRQPRRRRIRAATVHAHRRLHRRYQSSAPVSEWFEADVLPTLAPDVLVVQGIILKWMEVAPVFPVVKYDNNGWN
jgi:hypothetical protein